MKKSACAALFFSLDRREEQCPMIKAIADRESGIGSIVYGDRGDMFTRCDVDARFLQCRQREGCLCTATVGEDERGTFPSLRDTGGNCVRIGICVLDIRHGKHECHSI